MNSLISTLDLYFGKKAPQLPQGLKKFLVTVAPYLVILSLLFSIPAILALFGMSVAFGAPGAAWWGILTVIIVILNIMALPGLFKHSSKGWTMIFYATLVSLLQSLLMMNWIALILGGIISFYLLFQLKSYYFGGATHVASETPQATTV